MVIGILIAFQVDSWNEKKNERIRAMSYLNEIKTELLSNISVLDTMISFLDEYEKDGLYLDAFLSNTINHIDSMQLKQAYFRAGLFSTPNLTDIAYTNLLSAGEINLIENEQLKRKLGSLYNRESWDKSYHDGPMQEVYSNYQNYTNNHTDPLLAREFFKLLLYPPKEAVAINAMSSFERLSINWNDVINDRHYRILLDKVLTNRVIQRADYIFWKNQMTALIDNIDLELNELGN